MKIIKGTEIDEIEDLNFNLEKLRFEIVEKFSFWSNYEKTIEKYEESQKGEKAGLIYGDLLDDLSTNLRRVEQDREEEIEELELKEILSQIHFKN